MGLATAQCFPSHLPMAETPAEPESELLQGLNPPTHFTDKETEAERGGARVDFEGFSNPIESSSLLQHMLASCMPLPSGADFTVLGRYASCFVVF